METGAKRMLVKTDGSVLQLVYLCKMKADWSALYEDTGKGNTREEGEESFYPKRFYGLLNK